MKTLPETLEAHLAGQATTMCSAWRLTRRDGAVFGFTDHDRELVFDGTTFSAVSGFAASEVESALGLSVDSGEVAGAFSSAAVTEAALREGRFDGARVELFAVNWARPEDHVLMRVFTLGEVVSAGEAFRAELRGLAAMLDEPGGRICSRRCDADLGDGRCQVDLSAAALRGIGTVVAAEGRGGVRASGLGGFADGWFRHGVISWTSGTNAGLAVQVLDHAAEGEEARLSFWTPVANVPEPGDTFTVTAGCDKSFGTCRAKFSNGLNFQGFPHLPGSDFAYGYADGDAVHDGSPVVP